MGENSVLKFRNKPKLKYDGKVISKRNIFLKFSLLCFLIIILLTIVSLCYLYIIDKLYFLNSSFWFIFLFFGILFTLSFLFIIHEHVYNFLPRISKDKIIKVIRKGRKLFVKLKYIEKGDLLEISNGGVVPVDVKIQTLTKKIKTNDFVIQEKDLMAQKDIYVTAGTHIISGHAICEVTRRFSDSVYNANCRELSRYLSNYSVYHKYIFSNSMFMLIAKLLLFGLFLLFCSILLLIYLNFSDTYYIWKFSLEFLFVLFLERMVLINLLNSNALGKTLKNKIKFRNSETFVSLGFVTTLIIDDARLLCRNKHTLSSVWIDGNIMNDDEVSIPLYEEDSTNQARKSPTYTALTRDALLCNNADISPWCDDRPIMEKDCLNDNQRKKFINIDNEVDQSILLSFNNCDSVKNFGKGSLKRYRENNKTIFGPKWSKQFNSKISIHQLNDGDSRLLLVAQGDILTMLDYCRTVMMDGKEKEIDEKLKQAILSSYEELNSKSSVVRAFADMRLNPKDFPNDLPSLSPDNEHLIPMSELRFIGMIAFSDSLNSTTEEKLRVCQERGIKIIFTSADADSTLTKVIQQKFKVTKIEYGELDLSTLTESRMPQMFQITNISDSEMKTLIHYLQANNEIVGKISSPLTGLISLIASNIGIISGFYKDKYYRSCADVILDEPFFSLNYGIEESRRFVTQLKQIVTFQSFPKLTLIMFYMAFVLCGFNLPINFSFLITLEICQLFILPFICLCNVDMEIEKNGSPSYYIWPHVQSFIEIGSIQLVASLFAYLCTMTLHGFRPSSLWNLRNQWYSPAVNDVCDSYGQEWTYKQRITLDLRTSSTVLATLIILQAFTVVFGASNKKSIVKYIFRIKSLIFSALFSILVALLLVYFGDYASFMEFYYLRYTAYLLILPYVIYLIIFIEIKKLLMVRFNKKNWLH